MQNFSCIIHSSEDVYCIFSRRPIFSCWLWISRPNVFNKVEAVPHPPIPHPSSNRSRDAKWPVRTPMSAPNFISLQVEVRFAGVCMRACQAWVVKATSAEGMAHLGPLRRRVAQKDMDFLAIQNPLWLTLVDIFNHVARAPYTYGWQQWDDGRMMATNHEWTSFIPVGTCGCTELYELLLLFLFYWIIYRIHLTWFVVPIPWMINRKLESECSYEQSIFDKYK